MFKNPGTKWPILISLSIVGIIGASVWTVKVALNNPVEMSDYGMQNYHEYDRDANEIINAKALFDKKYTISFLTEQISQKGSSVIYKVTDKEGHAIDQAKIKVVLTRPDTNKNDIVLENPNVENGVYQFSPVDLTKPGRWDIMAKISVDNDQRYYNLKADTRNPNTFEF